MKRWALPIVVAAALVLLALVLRNRDQLPERPEETVSALFEAAQRGDDAAYLRLVSGQLRKSLKQARSQQGVEAFRESLKRSASGIKGLAVSRGDDAPDGFAVLCHDAPMAVSGGGLASLLSMVATRVEKVFAQSFKQAGYDPKFAPIYAQALIGMVTYVGRWWVDHPKLPADQVAEHLTALSWMGLRHLPRKPAKVAVPKRSRR